MFSAIVSCEFYGAEKVDADAITSLMLQHGLSFRTLQQAATVVYVCMRNPRNFRKFAEDAMLLPGMKSVLVHRTSGNDK